MAETHTARVAALGAVGLGVCCVLPLILGGLSVVAGVLVGSGLLMFAGVLGIALWWQRRPVLEVGEEGDVGAR